MAIRSVEYLQSLVRELAKLPDETEWVEFKCNNKQPQMIGEYISALSNSAALCERPKAYLVWGVDDATHKIVGTEFQYRKMKKGNEEKGLIDELRCRNGNLEITVSRQENVTGEL